MQTGLYLYGVSAMEEKCWEKPVTFLYRSREVGRRFRENSHLLVKFTEIFLNIKEVREEMGWQLLGFVDPKTRQSFFKTDLEILQ